MPMLVSSKLPHKPTLESASHKAAEVARQFYRLRLTRGIQKTSRKNLWEPWRRPTSLADPSPPQGVAFLSPEWDELLINEIVDEVQRPDPILDIGRVWCRMLKDQMERDQKAVGIPHSFDDEKLLRSMASFRRLSAGGKEWLLRPHHGSASVCSFGNISHREGSPALPRKMSSERRFRNLMRLLTERRRRSSQGQFWTLGSHGRVVSVSTGRK